MMCSGETIRRLTPPVVPDGTCLYEPDEQHRVIVQFASEIEAKRFFEFVKSLHDGEKQVLMDGGNA